MTNSSNMKFGIKLSPQHFPVGTQFKKSSSPLGKDDPNYDKILTATGYSYNGPCIFVIHYEGEEFILQQPESILRQAQVILTGFRSRIY